MDFKERRACPIWRHAPTICSSGESARAREDRARDQSAGRNLPLHRKPCADAKRGRLEREAEIFRHRRIGRGFERHVRLHGIEFAALCEPTLCHRAAHAERAHRVGARIVRFLIGIDARRDFFDVGEIAPQRRVRSGRRAR
ncbi:MAG: hypothetical protein WDM79_08465 [Terricaulis sp.]